MTFKDIIKFSRKRFEEISAKKDEKNIIFNKKYYVLFIFFIVIFFTYIVFVNQINSYSKLKEKNLNTLVQSNEATRLKSFFLESISSPYREYEYIIQNNDSIEKILNKYKVSAKEIKYIANELKKRKLSNIYAGREISIVIKDTGRGLIILLMFCTQFQTL